LQPCPTHKAENSPSTWIAVRPSEALSPRTPQTNIALTVSPYSWFGFTNTLKYRPLLNAHGVSVDIIPFFLGAARESAGNPFTPTPKWKEAFAKQDSETTGRLLGLKIVPPTVFPILSLYVSFISSNEKVRRGEE
jgi:2-hydroxychromene-2-carboxylate isomerase